MKKKKSQPQLPSEYSLLQALIESTPDAVFAKDLDGRYILFNSAAGHIVGKQAEEVIGKTDRDIFPHAVADKILQVDRELLRTGNSTTYEEILPVAGSVNPRTFLSVKGPLRDTAGNLIGLFGIARDITKNKRNEQLLQESEERHRRFIETTLDGFAEVDLDLHIVAANPHFEKMFGYAAGEMIGLRIIEHLFYPEDREAMRERMQRRQRGEPGTYEQRFRKKDGKPMWAIVSGVPVMDASGRVRGSFAMMTDITERKLKEESLQESEERYRILFESSRDAIMTLAPPSWKFTNGNPATVKLFGTKDVSEFVSLGPWELSPDKQPDGQPSADKAKEMIETAMRNGSHFFEWTHKKYNGEEFPATVLLTRIKLGETIQLQATVRDISEQKRAEEAVRVSEEKHRRLIENLSSKYFFYVHDTSGVFTYLSPSIRNILGYKPEDFMKHYTTYLTDHPVNQTVVMHTNLSISGIHQPAYEVNIRHQDGSIRWLEVLEIPLLDPGGAVVAVEGIACDITERHNAEEFIRERERFLMNVINSLDHPFIVVNVEDYRVIMANRAATRDVPPGMEMTCYSLSHGRQTPCDGEHPCPIEEMKRTGKSFIRDHYHVGKDGQSRHVEVHAHPVFDANGRLIQMIEYSLDVTDIDELQRQLVRTENLTAMGQLAAGVAHEFNNVLAMISLSAQRGLTGFGSAESQPGTDPAGPGTSPAKMKELFVSILSATDRGTGIVDNLLTLAQPGETTVPVPFKVEDILDRLIEMNHSQLFAHNIRIEKSIQPEVWALGSERKIEQVLLNLIINAEHAMIPKNGGTLSITIARHEPGRAGSQPGSAGDHAEVEIRVRDTGIGMTEEVLKKAFLPFFTTKGGFAKDGHKIPGTGLGLPICVRIIESHKGSIRAESKPGEWTEFILRLPGAEEQRRPVPAAVEIGPAAVRDSSLHILIVEDDEDLATAMQVFISDTYPDTHVVNSAMAALDQVAAKRPDVIITDYIMPDMRATELLTKLPDAQESGAAVAAPGTAGIPVVLVTGWTGFASVEERNRTFAGFYRVITKPYKIRDVLEVLDEIARRRKKP